MSHDLDLTKIRTYSLNSRPSKVEVGDFAQVPSRQVAQQAWAWIDGFSKVLAAKDLRQLVARLRASHQAGRPVLWGMGSHVIKTGLAPLLIDLMELGYVQLLAFNGSALIHDFETAYAGKTSEDVGAVLGDGSFGMAQETGDMVNDALNSGVQDGLGLGASLGRFISESAFKYKHLSLFAQAWERKIPATVHVAIGTDIIHMHERCDGSLIGKGSHRDFLTFAQGVSQLEGGGYINLGSAVILPEVFLKSVTLARNLGHTVDHFTTANFDFISHYRERVNVVERPTGNGGKGFIFVGHHELMVPLLHAGLKA